MSSPGEGLPPSGRPAGDRGARSPSHAPTLSSAPKVVGLQGGGLPTAAPRASPLCPAATGSLAERVPGVGTRSARPGGGARLHLGGPGACAGRGPGPRRASDPPLPVLHRPFLPTSTSRRTLVAKGGRQPPAARAFALTTSQPGLAPQGGSHLHSRGVRAGIERTEALEGVPRTCKATEGLGPSRGLTHFHTLPSQSRVGFDCSWP